MATERLHMSGEQPYHGYEAAAHVARYALLRPICAGRRVLDIACGEGYGSALLAGWGAERVVGIDLSAEAIESAEQHFAHPAVRFLQGNAEQAASLLADEPAFDVIVSFETIQQVANPAVLLEALRRLCAPGGTIVVSCPNDPATLAPGAVNAFHMRSYTFGQFRDFAEAILGPASDWLIETPAIGLLVYRYGDAAAEAPAASPTDIVRLRDTEACLQLPARDGEAPSARDCLAYIGVWGGALRTACAVSPTSHSGYMFASHKLERLEREVERVNREQQDDRRQLVHYAQTVAALRQSQAADQERAATAEQRWGEAHVELAALRAELAARGYEPAALRAEFSGRGDEPAALRAELPGRGNDLATLRAELAVRGNDLALAQQWRENIERSHFYRVLCAYAGLYQLPIVGPILGTTRRGAARLLHGIRRAGP